MYVNCMLFMHMIYTWMTLICSCFAVIQNKLSLLIFMDVIRMRLGGKSLGWTNQFGSRQNNIQLCWNGHLLMPEKQMIYTTFSCAEMGIY